jgi:hypothetical protein
VSSLYTATARRLSIFKEKKIKKKRTSKIRIKQNMNKGNSGRREGREEQQALEGKK